MEIKAPSSLHEVPNILAPVIEATAEFTWKGLETKRAPLGFSDWCHGSVPHFGRHPTAGPWQGGFPFIACEPLVCEAGLSLSWGVFIYIYIYMYIYHYIIYIYICVCVSNYLCK